MATDFDAIVAGAGVVGIACARELALSNRAVLCLDRAPVTGAETSSRNSEVIHAGIYYPPGSLKARTCIAGRDWLYRYCRERGVP
ncbi:MAG: FAD-dependent oxidoreductase, partial [bacterium]